VERRTRSWGRVCSWGARTGAEECEAGHVTDAALMGEGCAHGETRTEAEERKARRKKVEEETPSQPVVKTNLSDARQRLQIRRAPYYFRIMEIWFSSACGI